MAAKAIRIATARPNVVRVVVVKSRRLMALHRIYIYIYIYIYSSVAIFAQEAAFGKKQDLPLALTYFLVATKLSFQSFFTLLEEWRV